MAAVTEYGYLPSGSQSIVSVFRYFALKSDCDSFGNFTIGILSEFS